MNDRKVVWLAVGALAAASLSAETLTWTGAASAVWDLSALNWTNESGVATAWVNGSDALFPSNAVLSVSVSGDVELRHLTLAAGHPGLAWSDGGGSLTFVTDEATPTNVIMFANEGKHNEILARTVCVAPLLKKGNGVLNLRNANNHLPGGVVVAASQVRFSANGAIGPGDVTVLGTATLFSENVVAPDVKFVLGSSAWMGSVDQWLTIRGVGTTADNPDRSFHVGRSNNSACKVALALTDPASEGIGQYWLRGGGLRFAFDGGVVKAAPETKEVFFATPANLPAPMTARVTNSGITFDTAGATTELGLKLEFDAPCEVTNVVETVYPNDWSFENGSLTANWSVDNGGNTSEGSSSQPTNSAFMKDASGESGQYVPSYFTTNGARFAVIRRSHTLSQNVTLPAAGRWRVVYERGCRPQWGYSGHDLAMTVSLGGAANATVSPARSSQYPFRREETALFSLEAGSKNLSFAVAAIDKANYAVLLDAVRLERCEVVPVPVGPLVKTGAGTLAVTNLVTDGFVAVSNGTLAVRKSTLDGTAVDVAAGGTLALYATRLTNATVSAAAGGALSLRDGDGKNLVVNGSFEDNLLGVAAAQAYASNSGPRNWTLNNGGTESGIQANGSVMSKDGYYTSYGRTTAYLRPYSILSQTVEVPADGLYEATFIQGCRVGYPSHTIPLTFSIDGEVIVSNASQSASYDFYRSTARVNLTAGEHVFAFATGAMTGSYGMIFVDDVRLTSLAGTNALDGNALAFASGATLDLQNVEPIYLAGGVTVDGRVVKGSGNALRRAGVTVTGEGLIQIGPPQGTMLLFR